MLTLRFAESDEEISDEDMMEADDDEADSENDLGDSDDEDVVDVRFCSYFTTSI